MFDMNIKRFIDRYCTSTVKIKKCNINLILIFNTCNFKRLLRMLNRSIFKQ